MCARTMYSDFTHSRLWASTWLFNFCCFSLCLLPLHHPIILTMLFFLLNFWYFGYLIPLFYLSSLNDTIFPHVKKMRKLNFIFSYTIYHFYVVGLWGYFYIWSTTRSHALLLTLVLQLNWLTDLVQDAC